MKKMLFIYNPNAGTGILKPKLSDVLDIFTKAGYEITVYRPRNIMTEQAEWKPVRWI